MNKNNSGANTNTMMICFDVVTLLIAYLVELLIFQRGMDLASARYLFAIVFIFTIIYILSNKEARLYNVTLFFYLDRFYKIITKSWIVAVVITMVVLFVFNVDDELKKIYYIYLVISYLMVSIGMIVNRFIQYTRNKKRAPRAAFVGVFADYQKFNYFLNKTSIKVEETGYILKHGQESEGRFNVLGTIDDMEEIIRSKEVDQVYFIQKNGEDNSEISECIDICLEMGVTVKVIIDSYLMKRTNSYVSSIGTYPLITYHTITLNNYEQVIKRLMDIVISLIGIVLSSPIMLAAAIAIRIDSPGPIVFKQTRVGQNGRNFSIYKFRSMYQDAEERKKDYMDQNEMSGVMFKMKNDPRITKVGHFIRKTSIDELPQLFNVLRGTMSLVGTRPPTLDEVAEYKRNQWRRISIKPGITGMWQVSGRSNITDFDKVVELDLKYIDNWSIWLDIKLLFRTVGVLFGKSGAY